MDIRRIDCATCPVRDLRCEECIVPVLAGLPLHVSASDPDGREGLALSPAESATVARFVAAGLVAPDEAAGLRAHPVRSWSAATG